MSAEFTKVLVKDDRLDVTDNIKYAVIKGGQNVTCAPFNAISESASQVTFNIQVPSEQTIIDRRVLLETTMVISVVSNVTADGLTPSAFVTQAGTSTPYVPNAGQSGGYGTQMALAPFPLHQAFTVMSATINNNTVSINIRDVLPAITRLLDKRELLCYNGTTPTYTDGYLNYADALLTLNNPLGNYSSAIDSDIYPRGSFQVTGYRNQLSNNNLTLTEVFSFKLTEPLLLSPFIYSNPQSNSQGFYGIQNLNFIFNVGDASRVWRGYSQSSSGNASYNGTVPGAVVPIGDYQSTISTSPAPWGTPYVCSVSFGDALGGTQSLGANAFNGSRLLFEFLTPHPSDLMPAKNIVPYYELPRYITQFQGTATGGGDAVFTSLAQQNYPQLVSNQYLTYGAGNRISSQSLQLNQIPDKLIIFLRKQLGRQIWSDSDSCAPIQNLTINFNNNSGLLASAQVQDLYKMAKDNGSNQNWLEWSGLANIVKQGQITTGTAPNTVTTAFPYFKGVPTCGSYLVLEFGKDIQLVEDFYAPGSLGNFNLQVQVQFNNNKVYQEQAYELVIITMNSGVFVNERGTSSTYTGILTKADVLEASEQVPFTRADVKRMVGGGFLDVVKSAVTKLAPVAKAIAPLAGQALRGHSNQYAQMAGKALGHLGYGMSGSGSSGPAGGGRSGGRAMLGQHLQ